MSYTAYGWGKEHRIFCSTVFVFPSSLLLFWSSNKANYKGKEKKKGGTGGERAFKTIPFAACNKREYQGHGEASTKKKREKSPNEDVEISACEENWQKKSF